MTKNYISGFSLFLGFLVFILIYGYKIIDPTNINWVMSGDPGQHFLGWHFFRLEPWSFPIGAIHNYHFPSGTNIIYMDAIPIIGIPLKFFSDLLPQPFQYIGLWLMATYMLQGFFASLLLKKFTDNWKLILLGVMFFLLSPIMFWRAGGHEALAGHWLILASLYLYFSSYTINTKLKWSVLLIILPLVHFYLLVMVLMIWGAYLISYMLHAKTIKEIVYTLLYTLTTLLLILLVMWTVGYFSIPIDNVETGGFGYYSMNLLAPFNPMGGDETTFLTKIALASEGQYEGFNYLGLGILIMLLMALPKMSNAIKDSVKKRFIPLLIVLFLLYLFALSNKITFGSTVLLELDYPWILNQLGNILRSSGRMFWPVYYAIILMSIFIIIKYYTSKQSITILSVLLLIQIIDFYPSYHNRDLNKREFKNQLKSKQWGLIAKEIEHIVMIPPINQSDTNNSFALYTANNNLDINIGYVARENTDARRKYNLKLMDNFKNHLLDDKTLYIVDKNFLIIPNKEDKEKYIFGQLDKYHLIVPKNLNLNLDYWLNLTNWNDITNKTIPFNSKDVIFDGWSDPELTHRWSLNNNSRIAFKIENRQNLKGILSLKIGTLGEQNISIILNDKKIAETTLNSIDMNVSFQFNKQILKENKINILEFQFPNAHRPNTNDPRILAMDLKSFVIK